MIDLARQSYRYRDLLRTFITRELRARYRGSALGSFWILLQPLLYLAVYFVVFVQVLKISIALPGGGEEFQSTHPLWEVFLRNKEKVMALSMFVGLIPWIAFSEGLNRSTGLILENGNLLKKYPFPSQILPLYLIVVGLINCTIAFGILTLVMLLLFGGLPHFFYTFPLLLLLQGMFTLGLSYLVSSLTVFIRDVAQILPMFMTFWFFLSPIFYITKGLRDDNPVMWVVQLNPMRYLIETYREMFVIYPGVTGKSAPDSVPWDYIGIFALFAVGSLVIGYAVFMKLRPTFADEV